MKVQAIRTENGNFIANYSSYFFYVGSNRKTLLRMSDQYEWDHAMETWGENAEPRHISEIKEIIELVSMSEKVGRRVDIIALANLEDLAQMQNFEERFCYVNNDFNFVTGGYFNGSHVDFQAKCGGEGTSEYGNHGLRTSWRGESYMETVERFNDAYGCYPEVLVCRDSCHQSRQGDGWAETVTAYIMPKQSQIEAFLSGKKHVETLVKNMVLVF